MRELGLPMFSPDLEADPPAVVRALIDTRDEADGMAWSSPMYNGSVSRDPALHRPGECDDAAERVVTSG